MLKRREKDLLKAGIDPYALEDPASPEIKKLNSKENREKAIFVICFLGLLLAIALSFYAFKATQGPTYKDYAEEAIHVVGLTEDEFDISVLSMAAMTCEYVNAKGVSSDNGATGTGSASGYGPSLKTFMGMYGKTSSDFKRIRFLCKDGYSIALSGKKVEYDAVLSISKGDSALPEEQRPMRIIIPKESSGQWAYGVTRIEFIPA